MNGATYGAGFVDSSFSLDGIDAVLVEFSGKKHSVIGFSCTPWQIETAQRLKEISVPGQNEIDRLGILDSVVAEYGWAH